MTHRFENVSCSQCGQDFGPGDSGFSHCSDHRRLQGAAEGDAAKYLIDAAQFTVAPWDPTPWMIACGESAMMTGGKLADVYRTMLGSGPLHPAVMADSPFIVGGPQLDVQPKGTVAKGWIVVKEHVWEHGDGERPTLAYLWPAEFGREVFPSADAATEFMRKEPALPLGWVRMEISLPTTVTAPAPAPEMPATFDDWWAQIVADNGGDEIGNLHVKCSEVVLAIGPEQSQPVARCWFKVKP